MLPTDDGELLALAGVAGLSDSERGLFREQCWLRRVSGESVLLFGGGRALLLEVAHPLVAAGVADHSRFRSDPLGRLQRTLAALNDVVFGDRAAALEAARRVERGHAHVRGRLREPAGPFPAGTLYSGRDPDLTLWVWATLVDTALVVYQRFVAVLERSAVESYYRDHRVAGCLLGVPPDRIPPDYASFRAYFDGMLQSDALTVTPVAREIADAVLDPPVHLPGRGVVRLITSALLPERLRIGYGLEWDAAREARFAGLARSVLGLRADAGA